MKLLKFLSNRIVISFILIVIQMIWVALFVHFLFIDSRTLRWLFTILSVFVTLYIINNDNDDPGYKIIWLIPILSFPVFGGLLYIVFGNKKPTKGLQEAFNNQNEAIKPYIYFNDVKDKIDDPIVKGQVNYLVNEKFPIYNNSEIKYYSLGDDAYPDLLEELSKAKHFIFMEYFIVEEGKMFNTVLNILKQKVKEGVEVRFMYDDVGCVDLLPYKYYKELERFGIMAMPFNPIKPFVSTAWNNRDHRKVVVIDGHTAYTGGLNLSDEYINKVERFGYWKDAGLKVTGDAVWNFTVMFLQVWNAIRKTDEGYGAFLPHKHYEDAFKGKGFIQPYADNPLDHEIVGENVYLNIINTANHYVYIYTPYLIIDNEMTTALCLAAKRGVDIKIVTPGIPDKKLVFLLTQSYYKQLVEAGIHIYEYTPGFIHAKCFASDDKVATVGTINMDYRSLYLHFENGVFMYKNDAVMQLKHDMEKTFEISQRITKEMCQGNLRKTLTQSVLRLLAPLL